MRAMWAMMQRQQLGGWLCLLAMVLHLLAPLGHGCPRFDVDARDRLMTVSATGTRQKGRCQAFYPAGNGLQSAFQKTALA